MYTATYSPEDNKLRLYASSRLDKALYDRVRAAGFAWAPKQELFVAPAWSPAREDLLLELADEIDDENKSATERSADRAERFEGYREKRTDEAGGLADKFESGPAAFGHQNRDRAERQASRHDRNRTHAVSQWSKAEYWQRRTAGVISSALYKASPAVRRSRILRLESEQRKHDKNQAEYRARFAAWSKVPTLDGADKPIKREGGELFVLAATKLAYNLANSGGCWGDYTHPRTGRKTSIYSLLTDSADPITAGEAAALWLAEHDEPAAPGTGRWEVHYAMRLEYERAMLESEGGTAGEVEMVPGGWVLASKRTGSIMTDVSGGWMQIHRVNRSPATGKVVSVKVMGMVGYSDPKPGLVSINIERLGADHYRAPTPEDLAAVATVKASELKKTQARNAKGPKLINPTKESAEALQSVLNASKHYSQPGAVLELTQDQYTARSKGSYAKFEAYYLRAGGVLDRTGRDMYVSRLDKLPIICKVRAAYGSVIVITDKPQSPLPDWTKVPAGVPTGEVVSA